MVVFWIVDVCDGLDFVCVVVDDEVMIEVVCLCELCMWLVEVCVEWCVVLEIECCVCYVGCVGWD